MKLSKLHRMTDRAYFHDHCEHRTDDSEISRGELIDKLPVLSRLNRGDEGRARLQAGGRGPIFESACRQGRQALTDPGARDILEATFGWNFSSRERPGGASVHERTFRRPTSLLDGGRIFSTTSASQASEADTTRAPTARKASSENSAATPRPFSTTTLKPWRGMG